MIFISPVDRVTVLKATRHELSYFSTFFLLANMTTRASIIAKRFCLFSFDKINQFNQIEY